MGIETMIWTAKIGCNDPDELNVSRKSGSIMFAPTIDLMVGYQAGEISEARYTEIYLKCMEKSYQEDRDTWNLVMRDEPRMVFTCYCRAGIFCHRVLLAKFMESKNLGKYQGEI